MRAQFPHLATELDRFDALLRESGSATATLAQWAGAFAAPAPAQIRAHVVPCPPPPLTADRIARLAVAGTADVRYRRVRLVHAGRVLSDAENWYVPARLAPAMRHALENSATPFGTLIEPLRPTRETLSSDRLWSPPEAPAVADSDRLPTRLLHHRALVRDGAGLPICEVSEVYTRNILLLRSA
jgi:chorismate-pyruvate lyase